MVWIEFNWLKIETGGGFGFHKRREINKQLRVVSASHEALHEVTILYPSTLSLCMPIYTDTNIGLYLSIR